MSLEESMATLAASNIKLADAMTRYAGVMENISKGNPTSAVTATAGDAAKPQTAAQKKAAEKAAAEAASAGGADPFAEPGADAGGEADPFGADAPAEETAPAITAADIKKLVLKVKEVKGADIAMKLLKSVGVDTLGKIAEKDYEKVVENAKKVGVSL